MAQFEDILCSSCGLCCDGSIFAEVELSGRREADRFETMGLDIDEPDEGESAPLLLQPCAALKNKSCSIYKFRPNCCRTFECRLLREVKNGSIDISDAKAQVDQVHRQIQKIELLLKKFPRPATDSKLSLKERCQDALQENGPNSNQLEQALTTLDETIRKRFL